MNKSEVTIVMKETKGNKTIESVLCTDPHRKSKAIKFFVGQCLDDKHLRVEDLFKYLKESKRLNLVHLVKYAFERDD